MEHNRPRPSFRGIRRGVSTTAILSFIVLGGMLAATGWYFTGRATQQADPARNSLLATATQGVFRHSIIERGELESASNIEIRCEVQSSGSSTTTILWIIPEGTIVTAGEKLIEFNAAPFREAETTQQIVFEQARAAVIQAQLAYESAQIAVREYENGTFPQELKLVEAEIVLARENLRRAEGYAEYSQRLARKGYISQSELEADEFAVVNARLALEAAETKQRVLTEYTREKMLKQLHADAGMAESQWKAEQAKLELERAKLATIQEQITKCVVHSPSPGQVVYANDLDRRGNVEDAITEGMTVRERQVLIRLPDPASMQVRARVKEGKIGLVKPGQRAEVQIDALKGMKLTGEVLRVDPIAISGWGSSIKEYITYLALDSPPPGLKPGMTTSVEILVDQQRDVLTIPVQAVSLRNGKHYVVLKTEQGVSAQSVDLGPNNGSDVIVKDGLKADQVVVMDADSILADLVALVEPAPGTEPPPGERRGPGGPRGPGGQRPLGGPQTTGNEAGPRVREAVAQRDDDSTTEAQPAVGQVPTASEGS
jgi:multidrug resistance efflux pump